MTTAEPFPAVSLRELREEDAEQVAQLFRVAFGEDRPVDAEQVVTWVRNRELKPEWLRVVELDGRIVGYGDVAIDEQEVAVDIAAPGHSDRLFEWAEERAADGGKGAPRGLIPRPERLLVALVVSCRSRERMRTGAEERPFFADPLDQLVSNLLDRQG